MIFNRTAYCNAFIPTFSSPQSSSNSVMVSTNLLSFFSCNSKAFQVLHAADHKSSRFCFRKYTHLVFEKPINHHIHMLNGSNLQIL